MVIIGAFQFYSLPKDIREQKIQQVQPIIEASRSVQFPVLGASNS